MAIKNDLVGGTDWAEEGLKPTDINETFDATIKQMHYKLFEEATEDTQTGGNSFVDVVDGSFTISSSTGIILGITVRCELKTSSGGALAQVSFQATGTTLGTKYLSLDAGWTEVANDVTFTNNSTSYVEEYITLSEPLALADATTTLKYRFRISNGTYIASIKNMEVKVTYIDNYTTD